MKNTPLLSLNEIHETNLRASHGIFIKRPNALRKTFSIIPYTRIDGKKKYDNPLKIRELNELNNFLAEGKITAINADRQLKLIKRRIDEHIASLSVDTSLGLNLEIAEKYLKKKEAQSKNRSVSDISYRSSMIKAVRLLGKKSLISDSITDLQKEFDKNFVGTSQLHGNLANRVNTLLRREVGRKDALVSKKQEPRLVRYLTLKELEILISNYDDHDERVLVGISAYCGLRVGEIFGLTKKSLIAKDVLFISRQKFDRPDKKTGELYGLPKTHKRRKTIILDGGKKYVDEFLSNGPAHYELLRARLAERIRKLCLEIWPNDIEKQLNDFHDLRDIFAVHLVSRGSPIDSVAKLMGNSPAVCLENYQGFVASDREIDLVRSIISK